MCEHDTDDEILDVEQANRDGGIALAYAFMVLAVLGAILATVLL